jgi:hypothetical protein
VNRSMRMACLVVTLVSLVSAGLAGAVGGVEPADAFPADVAVAWFELLYDLVKEEAIVKFTTQRRQTDCLSVDVAQYSGSRAD